MKKKILIIEDNEDIRESSMEILELAGYEVLQADNGKIGVELAQQHLPDMILCDIMMPELDGYGVLYLLSKNQNTENIPFIFLTAKAERADMRKGMEMGADDYLTKPFSMEVLVARMEAILRRSHSDKSVPSLADEIALGNYTYIPAKMRLSIGETELKFTPKENELMKLLCENLGRPVSRSYALKLIWGDDTYFNARSMDVYMTKLRKMLKEDPRVQLLNLHGEGFRLSVEGL
jgi:DNA-binding response OmpR family regulator